MNDTEHVMAVQHARAVGVLTKRLLREQHGGWLGSSEADRRAFADAVLKARAHHNRAGLLRWRVVRTGGPDAR